MTADQLQLIPLFPTLEVTLDAPICLLNEAGAPIELGTPFLALTARGAPFFLEAQFAAFVLKDACTVAVVGAEPALVQGVAEQNVDEAQWVEWVTSMAHGLRHKQLHLLSDPAGPPVQAVLVTPDGGMAQ